MKTIITFIAITITTIGSSQLLAQNLNEYSGNELKIIALKSEFDGNYKSAISYLEHYHMHYNEKAELNFKLAELYYTVMNYDKAKDYYLKAWEKEPVKFAHSFYRYAEMLQILGDNSKSEKMLSEFKDLAKSKKKDNRFYSRRMKIENRRLFKHAAQKGQKKYKFLTNYLKNKRKEIARQQLVEKIVVHGDKDFCSL